MAPTLHDARGLAAIYGVSRESPRLYEARGLLRPVQVDGVRYYTPKDRVRLDIILTGKRLGFSLAEIESLVSTPPLGAMSQRPDQSKKLELDRLIEELQQPARRRNEFDG